MSTDALLESLIESDKELRGAITELALSVNNLVTMEAKREEREKIQVEKNKGYDHFIDENRTALDRLRKSQSTWDKVSDKVWAALVFALLGLLGFNFLG